MALSGKKVLGIIPARQGSKRIPKKNMVMLNQCPLIEYTIHAAQSSSYIDRLIVSSDCIEIIEFARKCNLDVPFVRPSELSGDTSTTYDVVEHAITYLEQCDKNEYHYICILEATSPFKETSDIDTCLELLDRSRCNSVMGLMPSDCRTPYRLRYVVNDEVVLFDEEKFAEFQKRPSQFPYGFIPGGGIYCVKKDALLHMKTLMPKPVCPYLMPWYAGLDINTKGDLILAELISKNKKEIRELEQRFSVL